MKAIILFIMYIVYAQLAFTQTWNSNCVPTGNMVATYRNDAHKLAIARVYQINSQWKDSIDIPQPFIDTVARVLYAIENMAWTPVKDTIMNMFGFRDFDTASSYSFEADSVHIHSIGFLGTFQGSIFMKKVVVKPTSGSVLATEWAVGNYYNTSYPILNSFLSKYGITVKANSVFLGNYYFLFPRSVNTKAITTKVMAMPDINYAVVESIIGDGNFIQTNYQNDGIQLEYRNGCGDCPAGCTYATRWFFKVLYSNCSVQYLGRIPIADGETAFQRVCYRGTVMANTSISIQTSLKNDLPLVNWKITSAENIKNCIVERSADGKNFMGVATFTTEYRPPFSTYSWTDEQPSSTTNYYRIKAIGLSGEIRYSAISKAMVTSLKHSLVMFPNPTKDYIHLQCNKMLTGPITITIADVSGNILLKKTTKLDTKNISIPTHNIQAGTYVLKLVSKYDDFRQIVVIVK